MNDPLPRAEEANQVTCRTGVFYSERQQRVLWDQEGTPILCEEVRVHEELSGQVICEVGCKLEGVFTCDCKQRKDSSRHYQLWWDL